ncbi:hypothetical protein OGAPHI_003317 [Ogataea philodendri]|uniref:Uncharacterized protein n=1 Tax=Ogataea philodendri TaxID=1378263 RepID=A0A9P8P798_9ASCO|nr:uncharacterized protein OGAPHI_003317 [Ogataea philodendri]KAH3666868.1 hypothetical protein OGAPHI_003317 [Ogataea philodendri]
MHISYCDFGRDGRLVVGLVVDAGHIFVGVVAHGDGQLVRRLVIGQGHNAHLEVGVLFDPFLRLVVPQTNGSVRAGGEELRFRVVQLQTVDGVDQVDVLVLHNEFLTVAFERVAIFRVLEQVQRHFPLDRALQEPGATWKELDLCCLEAEPVFQLAGRLVKFAEVVDLDLSTG